ncbi:MAG TPA: T9SS type A sorting domain-containing protein [Lacibacter sp.]|nr:T9SS type A sorting domain-containing protein [Lacibacter sp.]
MLRMVFILSSLLLYTCHLFAQVDVQNNGVLYIGAGTDSFFIGGNFTNQSTGSLTNHGKLYLARNFTNAQSATPQGTGELILFGSAAQTISTTSNSPLNKLTILKTSNIATLASAITVNSELKFTAGKLSLSDYDLTLGNSASITGSSAGSYAIAIGNGGIQQQVTNNSNRLFPVGTVNHYTPATVALNSGSTTDIFKVRMLPAFYKNGSGGITQNSYVVNCLWNVSEANTGGSNASLTLQWPSDLELIGFDRSLTRIAHYHNSDWDYGLTNIEASGTNPYTATRNGITDFSPFGIANFLAVLPDEQLQAEVIHLNNNNTITWKAVNGSVADYFEIEYSAEGEYFTTLSRIMADPANTAHLHYRYIHSDLNGRLFYYRVKQVEKTGKTFYSKVLKVTLNKPVTVTLYPNPAVSTATIEMNNTVKGIVSIKVTDVLGRTVYTGQQLKNNAVLKMNLDVAAYPNGIYKVILTDEKGHRQLLQFVKH